MAETAQVIVICGVSGAGKTTIGARLAARLGWTFHDADDFHPAANVAKMARGEPLTDTDRAPWLDTLRALIDQAMATGKPLVLACSALKASYRTRLGVDQQRVVAVWLDGTLPLIAERIAGRNHAFMPAALLASQFEAAEPPTDGIRLRVQETPDALVDAVVTALGIGIDIASNAAP